MKKQTRAATGKFTCIEDVESAVIDCFRCPRLVAWRQQVAREKVHRFQNEEYWGRPVPGFGDPCARVLVIGLAPAAHGGNRTGRIFTGDRSGDWLFRALYDAGFANQPTSTDTNDGLRLSNIFISATVRCAPPGNKPLPQETINCRNYLESEVQLLWPHLRVTVVLGKIAFDWWISYLRRSNILNVTPSPKFAHGAEYHMTHAPTLLCSFHPSQQNTYTGKLTRSMFDAVWQRARELADF